MGWKGRIMPLVFVPLIAFTLSAGPFCNPTVAHQACFTYLIPERLQVRFSAVRQASGKAGKMTHEGDQLLLVATRE